MEVTPNINERAFSQVEVRPNKFEKRHFPLEVTQNNLNCLLLIGSKFQNFMQKAFFTKKQTG
jgi:hypothetical protein